MDKIKKLIKLVLTSVKAWWEVKTKLAKCTFIVISALILAALSFLFWLFF